MSESVHTNVLCETCGNGDARLFFNEKAFAWYRCTNCSTVFLHPKPEIVMEKTEGGDKEEEYYLAGSQGRLNFAEAIMGEIKKYKKIGRILDVGCGGGFLLSIAKINGWEVLGIEPSAKLCRFARNNFGLNILENSIEDNHLAVENNSFDVVVMWNVLSHLKNPKLAIAKVAKALKAGGLLVVRTGNKGDLTNKKAGELFQDGGWRAPLEMFHFSGPALKLLLGEDFEIARYEKKTFLEELLSKERLAVFGTSIKKNVIKRILL